MNAATASPSTSSNNQDTLLSLLGQLNRYLACLALAGHMQPQ